MQLGVVWDAQRLTVVDSSLFLKRSACRTVPRSCGVQVMIAGRSATVTEPCLKIMLVYWCLLAAFLEQTGEKAPRLFVFGRRLGIRGARGYDEAYMMLRVKTVCKEVCTATN